MTTTRPNHAVDLDTANPELTRHAHTRMRQRGSRDRDIGLVLQCGTQAPHGRVMLSNSDVEREVTVCKRRIQLLERLRGAVVVCEDGSVVTCYHADGKAGRRTFRETGGRGRSGSRRDAHRRSASAVSGMPR